MKNFLKKGELELKNGGYLVSTNTGEAIFNQQFVELQEHAHYLITFAKHAKGKDFEGKKADTIGDIMSAVEAELKTKQIEFVTAPKMGARKITDALKKEAMDFINNSQDVSKAEKINNFLQKFRTLQEFEEFGLFFTEDVVKLNKIYTVAEVVAAVTECIDLVA